MLSANIVAILKNFLANEKDDPFASHETKQLYQFLDNITLDSQASDKAQLVAVLTHLDKSLDNYSLWTNWVSTATPHASNKDYLATLDKNTEIGLTPTMQNHNRELRNEVRNQIYKLSGMIANDIEMVYDRTYAPDPKAVIEAINQNQTDFRYKMASHFAVQGQLRAEDISSQFSHVTQKVNKPAVAGEVPREKNLATWFMKFHANKITARRELIAQELFRFVMPYQPKTRIARDDDFNFYILSKGSPHVTNFDDIDKNYLRNGLANGTINGYGKLSVINLFLNETDAKCGNMFLDNKSGNVIKIDGDWCFSSLQDPAQFKDKTNITALDIQILPYVVDYKPFNWIDLHEGGVANTQYVTHPQNTILSPELASHPGFRNEVNEGLMSVLLMDDAFLQKFIEGYIHNKDEISLLTKELVARREQTLQAALANDSFKSYMQSPAAEKYLQECILNISQFSTHGKNRLFANAVELNERLMGNFHHLKSRITPKFQPEINSAANILTMLQNTPGTGKDMPYFPPPPIRQGKAVPPPLPMTNKVKIMPPPVPLEYQKKAVPLPLPPRKTIIKPPPLPPKKEKLAEANAHVNDTPDIIRPKR